MIIDTITSETAPPEPKRCNLYLHHGTNLVTRGDIAMCPTPAPTETWNPVPHLRVLQTVERALLERGHKITGQGHGLTHDGARYFGLLEVDSFGGGGI